MKQILFFILFATLFVACDNNPENLLDLTAIRIKEKPCEMLEYVGRIGYDFDIALDSLRKLKSISSEIIKEPVEVLFDYDDRQFLGITYGDCGMYADVLDTKGNYYLRTWYCPDENDLQEEPIFEKNKVFNISNGCITIPYKQIIYNDRIGKDFNSALDSLRNLNSALTDLWADGYDIEQSVISIDFDDREFYLTTFVDKIRDFSLINVIDNKGNLYDMIWCDD